MKPIQLVVAGALVATLSGCFSWSTHTMMARGDQQPVDCVREKTFWFAVVVWGYRASGCDADKLEALGYRRAPPGNEAPQ